MSLRKFLFIAGIWSVMGLIYSGQSFFYYLSVGHEFFWRKSLFHSFVFCLEWMLLTVPILRLAERFPVDSKNLHRTIPVYFFIGIIIGLCQQTVYVVVVDFVEGGFAFQHTLGQMIPFIVGFFEYGVLISWSLVFIFHAFNYYKNFQEERSRAAALYTQLIESQLQALKMQLQPHFLFNTLNAINVLVKKKPALAQKMVTRLSGLLRMTLEQGFTNEVQLEKELEFLNAYLSIEKVRFGKRLKYDFYISKNVLDALVPTFLLQPLVENSIRHNIAHHSRGGWIKINAGQKNKKLEIEVVDGGGATSDTNKKNKHAGIGLENIQQRIKKLYGDDCSLKFIENDFNGITVKITLPLNVSGSSISN